MQLQSLIAMTSRTANPAATFVGLAALAEQVQKNSYLPPRRSLAKTADAQKLGFSLDPDEAAAVMRAAEYARAPSFDQDVNSAIFSKLQGPLQAGDSSPAEVCKAAAKAIDDLLAARAGGGPSATPSVGT